MDSASRSGALGDYEFLNLSVRNRVLVIELNRPDVLNALHLPMHYELQRAFDDFAADPGLRVCVITGAGEKAFCAGSDLKDAAVRLEAGEAFGYPASGYAGLIERFDLSKPIIAAVNGFAVGGGFEIVLACDLVVAVESARFALPEPLVGAVALGGGLHRLARQIGLKQAMSMILTGRMVDASEGRTLGFVNEVVRAEELWPAVDRWIEPILRASPAALGASKQTVMQGLDEPSVAAAMRAQEDYPAFRRWRESPDGKEGARAFAERRPPRWKEP